jgi:hypothetical protein
MRTDFVMGPFMPPAGSFTSYIQVGKQYWNHTLLLSALHTSTSVYIRMGNVMKYTVDNFLGVEYSAW